MVGAEPGGIAAGLVPLLLLTRRRDIVGVFVNNRLTTTTAATVATLIIGRNAYLIFDAVLG